MYIRISTFVLLVLEWIGLNGIKSDDNKLSLLLFPAIVYVMSASLGIIKKNRKYKFTAVLYIFWLFKEIITASLSVIKIVWNKNIDIDSGFKWISSKQLDNSRLVIYNNSITVTPGTVALEVRDEMLLVHALEKSSLRDLETGRMNNKITQLI
ncbi:MAG: Na+/H+ antiporter subunit E [Janthinobacterium lividum]